MPTPRWQTLKIQKLQKNFKEILETLGYDLKDPNICGTPKRAANLWFEELYKNTTATKKMFTTFPEKHRSMIVLVRHHSWSRCPHHLERVKLIITVGYIPDEHVLGISKLARLADYYAKGLELQENLTENLAEGLFTALTPKGVGVHVVGEHHCMCARGVESEGKTVTTVLKGNFLEEGVKAEFLQYALNTKWV